MEPVLKVSVWMLSFHILDLFETMFHNDATKNNVFIEEYFPNFGGAIKRYCLNAESVTCSLLRIRSADKEKSEL